METPQFTDTLSVLGFAVGVFLVLAGLVTIAGTPWTTTATPLPGFVRVLGALLTLGVGAGLAWMTQPTHGR